VEYFMMKVKDIDTDIESDVKDITLLNDVGP
jgi:hypothetical protein